MPEKHRRPHSHERVQAVEKMRRAWAAERDALTAVRHFNSVAFCQRLLMVLAQDLRCANFKTSLANNRVRRLWDRR